MIVNGLLVPDVSVQFKPPSVEYEYLSIVAPPLSPAVNATDNCALDGVIAVMVGASGAVEAETGRPSFSFEAVPEPTLFTARNKTW